MKRLVIPITLLATAACDPGASPGPLFEGAYWRFSWTQEDDAGEVTEDGEFELELGALSEVQNDIAPMFDLEFHDLRGTFPPGPPKVRSLGADDLVVVAKEGGLGSPLHFLVHFENPTNAGAPGNGLFGQFMGSSHTIEVAGVSPDETIEYVYVSSARPDPSCPGHLGDEACEGVRLWASESYFEDTILLGMQTHRVEYIAGGDGYTAVGNTVRAVVAETNVGELPGL